MAASFVREELNLVLVGFAGGGKTSTANTILGKKEFVVSPTSKVASAQGHRIGIDFNLIDTPGLLTTKDIEHLHQNITTRDGIKICFLVVIKLKRFTDEESFALSEMLRRNPTMLKRTVVVFTNLGEIEDKDTVVDRAIDRFLKRNYTLLSFLKRYNLSYVGLENKFASENDKEKRVKVILEAVKKYANVLEDNGKTSIKQDSRPKADHKVLNTERSEEGEDSVKRKGLYEENESHHSDMSIDDHVARIVQQKLDIMLPMLKKEIKEEIENHLRKEIREEILPSVRDEIKNEFYKNV
ncbi:GTPase IMAP family member 9-like [Saccostrea echinata]|uniref:GTPase IMAP family member 9-like n=1 Tax=Saccostrea echinata TaxID=191078 RepID=UPI002A82AFC3|nr:GTPase IMAP family member 9-like [Saccostrea echinata]